MKLPVLLSVGKVISLSVTVTSRAVPQSSPSANTFTVPANQTAAGSADIMSHIMEVYFSQRENSDMSEGMCENILKSFFANSFTVPDCAPFFSDTSVNGFSVVASRYVR